MSSFFPAIRVSLLAMTLIVAFAPSAFSADPKIVRASHSQAASEEPKEISDAKTDTKSDDMSYSPQWPEPPNTGAMLTRLCFGTVAVLVICVGTLWFGKPWLQKLKVTGAGSPSLYIEGSVAVGNRAMLYLVRVGGTQLVAGTDATGLKTLIAIPASFKDVLDEQVPENAAEAPTASDAFQQNDRPVFASSTAEVAKITSTRTFGGRTAD